MLTGILTIAFVAFIAVISYRHQRFEERLVKQIPLIDWLLMFVFPMTFYVGLINIVNNIVRRPRMQILDFDDSQILGLGIFFMVYAVVGISVHFVSKVLSRYIKQNRRDKAYRVNEIFHGKLSHYITFACAYLLVFSLALLEINHPLTEELNRLSFYVLAGVGIVAGFSAFKGIFITQRWIGGHSKPFFFISLVLLFFLTTIYKSHRLSLAYYPMNVFILLMLFTVVCIYVGRMFFRVAKLSGKRKLKFISRLLSLP